MDSVRKCAIAVVMIVPGFVLGGLVWSWFHSWFAVLGVEVLVVMLYIMIISGRFSKAFS
jgi:hypothetical protein